MSCPLTSAWRFNMALIGPFAIVAVSLAAIGVAGVIALAVASRTREIGLRLALGASPARVVAEFVRHGLTLTAGGMVLGTIGAVWRTGSLRTRLYGVPRYDPVTLAITLVTFALVSGGDLSVRSEGQPGRSLGGVAHGVGHRAASEAQ